jgi:hypothetical protein
MLLDKESVLGSDMVADELATHPFRSVMANEYEFGESPLKEELVDPFDQE